MKIILFCLMLFTSSTFSQFIFEKQSESLKLDIKFPPPDSVKPTIKLQLVPKKEGYPIYSKDTLFSITGQAEDNLGKVTLYIQDQKQSVPNGNFQTFVSLKPGSNLIYIKAVDRRNNIFADSLKIIFDPGADVVPPMLKITEPSLVQHRGIKTIPKSSEGDSLFLKGKVLDDGNLLGVWINGEEVPINEASEFKYPLYNLYDSVTVEAADVYGNLSIEKFLLSSDDPNSIPDSINYHAIIIAVQDYYDRKIGPLDNPIKDGQALYNVLTEYYKFDERNIVFLKNPNRNSIIEEFQNCREKLQVNDNLLVFYAGHGKFVPSNKQGYWIPADGDAEKPGNWISNDDVKDYLRGIKSKHVLVIADACFAGSLSRTLTLSEPEMREFEEYYKEPSRHMLSSSIELNSVPDKSVFIKYLIKSLEDNVKKILPGKELAFSLKGPVMNNSEETPVYTIIPNTGDTGSFGDFVFIRK